MVSKKVYILESNITRETVTRSHSDIRWLHEDLKEECPGLLLPPIPERSKDAINNYFTKLLDIEQLRTSYLLNFFVSCVSDTLFKDFKEKKGNLYKTSLKEQTSSVNKPSINKKDVEQILLSAEKLKDITFGQNADFNNFSSKVNELAGYSVIVFNDIAKALDDLSKQILNVSKTINHIADLFGNLSLQSRKITSAKEQFPDPRIQSIDLEQVYAKYKLLFYNTGQIIRSRV